jgi:predicted dehydrogenase
MKKLGLGVLGLGEGRSIISAGLHSPMWDVVVLCDTNEKLCQERCQEFGLTKYTLSYDDLLKNKDVDVVGIYTPDHLHAAHVIKALEAGKHVVCTKPFLNDLTTAKDVLAVSRKSGKRVMVGQSSRYFAPFIRQRQHFESGALGEIETVEAYYNADHRWFLKKGWAKLDSFKWLYGGISHPADLLRWYMPEISEVMGYAHLSQNGKEMGLVNPDTYHFVMKASDGRVARISGTYSCPTVPTQRDSNMSCVLRGTKGASQGDYYDLRYSWKVGDQSAVESFEGAENYFFRFQGHSHHAGEYQNYLEYFARCLESGDVPKPDVAEGIVTVALMQAMEDSLKLGQPVRVVDVLRRHGVGELVQ